MRNSSASEALIVFFFFSSRRRHTIFDCDWSSDVCSPDLAPQKPPDVTKADFVGLCVVMKTSKSALVTSGGFCGAPFGSRRSTGEAWGWVRSEERRGGKECRSRWSPDH